MSNGYWNNLLIRIFNKKNSWSSLINFSEKLNLESDFNDNLFLISKLFKNRKSQVDSKSNLYSFLINEISSNLTNSNDSKILYNYNDFLEINRWAKRSQGTNSPLRIIKYPISNKTNFDFNKTKFSRII